VFKRLTVLIALFLKAVLGDTKKTLEPKVLAMEDKEFKLKMDQAMINSSKEHKHAEMNLRFALHQNRRTLQILPLDLIQNLHKESLKTISVIMNGAEETSVFILIRIP